jgi:hypothetical protein
VVRRFQKSLISAVVATLGASLFMLGGPLARAGAADAPVEASAAAFMNGMRTAAGLAPLATNLALTGMARGWTDHLTAVGGLSHNPALATEAPAGWATVGENVGMGGSLDGVDQAFAASPPHRANILGAYDAMGIGVDIRGDGTLFITVDFIRWQPGAAPVSAPVASCIDHNPVPDPSSSAASGYYVLGSDGGIFAYGKAPFLGSVPGLGVHAQASLMAETPSQRGYWILGADGGVFSFGDAHFYGSVPGIGAQARAVDLKSSKSGKGYWVLGQDGSVFSFGDAVYAGSLPGAGVRAQAVRLVPTPSGHGYWILGADGGIFSFGDAAFHGSLPGVGVHDGSISLASTISGNGYWILGADGGIFSFGDATYKGSVPGLACQQASGVQLVASADGHGYYVLASDGRVFSFGDAPGYGQPASLGVTALDLAVFTA